MTLLDAPSRIESPPELLGLQEPLVRHRSHASLVWTAAFGLTIAIYIVMLAHYWQPAITHPDANGYWAQASLIAQTGHSWFVPESDAQYIGMHWLLGPDGIFLSRYPPGFPMLIGAVYKLLGWQATLLINPALAVLTLIGVWLIVRRLTSPGWALLAVIFTAVNAAFTEHALTYIAHMPVACCLTWGVYLLLRWASSARMGYIFLAGVVLGFIPTARYPDAVVAVGVAAFMLMQVRRIPKVHLHYAAAVLGAAIPIVPLLIRNQLLLGGFWKTGYALTNEQTGFGWNYFTQHALGYLQLLQNGGIGLTFVLAMAGLAWMIAARPTRALGLLIAGSAVPMLLLYMAYYWAPGVGTARGGPGGGGPGGGGAVMRFLVPIVPMLAITATWMLAQSLHRAPTAVKVTVPAMILLLLGLMAGPGVAQSLQQSFTQKQGLAMTTIEMDRIVPQGAIVVADNALLQQIDFVRHWKLADGSIVNRRGRRSGSGGGAGVGAGGRLGAVEDAPSPRQVAKSEARAALYTGSTSDKQEKFLNDIDAWAKDQPVYVVGAESDLTSLLPVSRSSLEVVGRVKIPDAPEAEEDDLPPGGPGGPPARVDNARRARGGGGMFGRFAGPGQEIVIARWN